VPVCEIENAIGVKIMKTFHQEIDASDGQNLQISVDKPVHVFLLTDGEYEKYTNVEAHWVKFSFIAQPPSSTIVARGDGHWHLLIEPVNREDDFTVEVSTVDASTE
jgi:hypothetical protein